MDRPLEGQHAIVMGGESGIGFGSARLLAADGAVVTLAGRTEQKLREAAIGLQEEGPAVRWVKCDGIDGGSVRRAVEAAADDGRLHIAVVAPGGGSISPALLHDDDQFGQEVDQNGRLIYLPLKYAGQAMIRAGFGSYVPISSIAAAFSCCHLAAYSAGKAAIDQLIRIAADELGEYGVRVNAVRPGMIHTPATAHALAKPAITEAFRAGQAIKRTGSVSDIALGVRHFAGASGWRTGAVAQRGRRAHAAVVRRLSPATGPSRSAAAVLRGITSRAKGTGVTAPAGEGRALRRPTCTPVSAARRISIAALA
jgi:NAD(P)-dependent dehydrogenase (short-subunit alcohol dehydrogenase family)